MSSTHDSNTKRRKVEIRRRHKWLVNKEALSVSLRNNLFSQSKQETSATLCSLRRRFQKQKKHLSLLIHHLQIHQKNRVTFRFPRNTL